MGSLDVSECCEMIGLYMLNKMSTLIGNESNGIYRDNGFIAIEGNGRDIDLSRKKSQNCTKIMVFK